MGLRTETLTPPPDNETPGGALLWEEVLALEEKQSRNQSRQASQQPEKQTSLPEEELSRQQTVELTSASLHQGKIP